MMESAIKLQNKLNLKPENAVPVARAYEIPQVKIGFLKRYEPARDGFDPLIAFANAVFTDFAYREEVNRPLYFAHEMKI